MPQAARIESHPSGEREPPDWVARFAARHGRAPRVLHLGNIANNAFHNAKLMRREGLDCDVVCYDYYHIMACPEWEDADFSDAPADQFRPDWGALDLHGYERPRWFVQGPDMLCIAYLKARLDGRQSRAELLWRALGLINRTRVPAHAGERILRAFMLAWVWSVRQLQGLLTQPDPWAASKRRLQPVERRAGKPFARVLAAGAFALAMSLRAVQAAIGEATGRAAKFRARTRWLMELYETEFADRGDRIDPKDVVRYQHMAEKWRPLFERYDFVQGYATDPILPMLCGTPYFAFEHGTLRVIPFEATAFGRMTALAYRKAEHVFVTNSDCMDNARYLAGERITFINHPFDDEQSPDAAAAASERAALRERLGASFLFFFPTRHDWTRPGADKANDVFLRAFCRLRNAGQRVGLVCCAWGGDVQASKALIAEAGCTDAVEWTAPMGIVRFGRVARACDVVVDQFRLGAFGGVMFKALAYGAPVMTYLDEAALRKLFPEPPPVINCRTEDEIMQAALAVINDPARLARLSDASRAWLTRFHHGRDTALAQAGQYRNAMISREGQP